MKTVVSLIAKIRTVKGPNEADKGVYNYFFDGEKYGVEEPASGEGRRYAGPFTLRAQSVLIGNSLTTLFGFESAAPSGGEVAYLNNPASNIGTENPYLAVVYHKDHLGSTRAVTKTDGTILEQNDYYPFGLRTTRGENYSTLSQSLAAIAQNANNTTVNTVVPEYLYNGKEKQDFIKNTSAVINAGGSTDYTSNYIDYGARFYNPTTLRWNTQDPMAEKYQRYSPYNYCVNNPISLVDPNGEKIVFVNGLTAIGNNTPGKPYWNKRFIEGAKNYYSDYKSFFSDVTFLNYKYISADYRFKAGYKYAEEHFNDLISDLGENETFKFVSHSMGAAFAEGMAKYLEEHGYKIEAIIHINAYQASSVPSLTKAIVTDYQVVGDPVIFFSAHFNPILGFPFGPPGFIRGADKHIRRFSNNYLKPKYIHMEPINSGPEFWESLDRKDYKDTLSYIVDVLLTIIRMISL